MGGQIVCEGVMFFVAARLVDSRWELRLGLAVRLEVVLVRRAVCFVGRMCFS